MVRTFDVKGTWEGDTILTPASTVRDKIAGLSSTRGPIRKGKVVATTNQTGIGGTGILGGEVRVLVAWNETSVFRTTGTPSPIPVPSVALT